MGLLYRYIFMRSLVASAASLASLVSIIWIVQALSRIDIVKTSASAAGNIFWIALMLMPDLLAGIIPFAVLIGAVQTLNALNAGSERAVMAASGMSQRGLTRPILALGLLGGALMLVISNFLAPIASHGFQNAMRNVNADTITVFLTPGRFEEVQDGLLVSVGQTQGQTLSDLVISDRRDPTTDLAYFSREARIVEEGDQSVLLLRDGQLHRRVRDTGNISVIEFETYAFDLADLRPSSSGGWVRTAERNTLDLISPDPDDPIAQQDPNDLLQEVVDRLSNWLFAIAFALWAVVVGGPPATNRKSTSSAMTLGLVGGLGLKALGFVAVSMVSGNPMWSILVFALPLSAIALNTTLILREVDLNNTRLFRATADGFARLVHFLTPRRFAGGAAT